MVLLDRGVLLVGRGSFVPWFQRDEEERVERGVDGAEQIVADHGRDVRDAGRGQQRLLDLAGRVAGALHGRGVGQLQGAVEITLIFLRQEA